MAKDPYSVWWTMSGKDLMAALKQAHDGETPEMVYMEMYANSTSKDYGSEG